MAGIAGASGGGLSLESVKRQCKGRKRDQYCREANSGARTPIRPERGFDASLIRDG